MGKRIQKQIKQAKVEVAPSAEPDAPENISSVQPGDQIPVTALLAATSDAIVTVQQDFHVVDLNPAARDMLGVAENPVSNQLKCMDVLRCQNLNHVVLCHTSGCPLTRVIQDSRVLANEELIFGANPNHTCEVSASVTPISDDEKKSYVVFVARDTSVLKVANSVRSNFVSMVSHELRTPLNSVHGFIDLLLQGHMGKLNDEQQLYLGYTQEGVQQLISIVEDILFMTRSDLGQFEIKPQEVHLQSLALQIMRSLQPQALKAEVALVQDIVADAPTIYADPQRILQVLNNLVANAIKFTPPGGSVIVSSRPHNERFEMISVSDTGYGIPVEDCQHVFERFYQSNHSQQSKMGGYGLGLSIAKLIIEQHGGSIGLDSILNKGTTFYFTMPIYLGQHI